MRVTDEAVFTYNVEPDAGWLDSEDRFKLRSLTRIQCGGHYEATLHELAGLPPLP